MRIVALLTVFFCAASMAVAPDAAPSDGIAAAMAAPEISEPAAADAEAADYRALQRTADLALEALRQSRERRLAVAQAIIQ